MADGVERIYRVVDGRLDVDDDNSLAAADPWRPERRSA